MYGRTHGRTHGSMTTSKGIFHDQTTKRGVNKFYFEENIQLLCWAAYDGTTGRCSTACFSEAGSAAETGPKCIFVHIHPTLDSSRSEDSQLGPVGGMTSERSV